MELIDMMNLPSRIGLENMLSPPQYMTPEEARLFIKKSETGALTLLDVREPNEYEEDHIPGAQLVPLAALIDSLKNLDRRKPTIVYCAVGGRSSVAVRMLTDRGFAKVYNLKGGIEAWKGGKVTGPVDLHLRFLEEYDTPEKIMASTYGMEAALAGLYRDLAGKTTDEDTAKLLGELAVWEEKHMTGILAIAAGLGLAEDVVKGNATTDQLEGGIDREKLLAEQGELLQTPTGILEVAMMVEATAMDLYLRIADALKDRATSEAFRRIGDEEKIHLESLGRLLEKISSNK